MVKTPGDLPLSQNPLSVEPLTLFRMSQSAVQVIWNLGGRAKVCKRAVGSSENVKSLWCFRSWHSCLVESGVWCQLFLCPRRSHFTLLFGVCLNQQHYSSCSFLQLYLGNKEKKTQLKTENISLFRFFRCFCPFGFISKS